MYLINHNNIKSKTEKCTHLMLLLIYGKFFKIFYPQFLNCKISDPESDTQVSGSGIGLGYPGNTAFCNQKAPRQDL